MAAGRAPRRSANRGGRLLLLTLLPAVAAQCPLLCSGHGRCASPTACECYPGWRGPACAERTCPAARAWVSYGAGGADDAHGADAECAGAGTCSRATGKCACRAGFTGDACERLACPAATSAVGGGCGGRGRCMTLAAAAAAGGRDALPQLPHAASLYTGWDADRVQGCVCDRGWGGADCRTQLCPAGADPAARGAPRVAAVRCECPGGLCGGDLRLRLRGRAVELRAGAAIAAADEDAGAALGSGRAPGESVESVLRAAAPFAVSSVSVRAATAAAAGAFCADGNALLVTFTRAAGNGADTALEAEAAPPPPGQRAPAVYVEVVAAATAPVAPCSARGVCDARGQCACFKGYYASDGDGAPGTRPDCGATSAAAGAPAAPPAPAGCPLNCNGRGWCDAAAGFVCRCADGFSGGACEVRACPTGRAWFDQPAPDGSAHAEGAVCSNAGACGTTGACTCFPGFTGARRGGGRGRRRAHSALTVTQ
jgi:hypothetical protein